MLSVSVFLISDLCTLLETYLDEDQVAEVYRAYLFGAEAHEGQRRMSGEPYIYHPIAVAKILAEMRLDHKSIAAAILHDVIEDTPTAREQLVEKFGEEVAYLVDGVSKLTTIQSISKAEAQAESFRKMILAMVKDIRVILIKLADRLHNMRTLTVMRPEKRRRIAAETLAIYSPIALRLGINRVRLELEELGFAAYHPLRHRILKEAMRKVCGNRREPIEKLLKRIRTRLERDGVNAEVFGREKHLYSLYQKMKLKKLPFSEISDIFGFRIVVDSVDSCYRTLGIIHSLFKPIPGKFNDYIAIPKGNGYQSLHTAMQSRYGFPIEIQIRTQDMERVAEAGIASHWIYKSGSDNGDSLPDSHAREWLHGLLEMQQNAGDSLEFLESVKVDLFPDEVYIFTPKGEILALPRGATVIDFAYSVHTQIGDRCTAASIDGRSSPLHTILRNGQKVKVITHKHTRPNPAWLNFVTTAKARTNIRNHLKTMQQEEAVILGRRLLKSALGKLDRTLSSIPEERFEPLLNQLELKSAEELFAEIGVGNRIAPLMARSLIHEHEDQALPHEDDEQPSLLSIRGTEGSVVQYAKCCRPIPGDPIFGFLTTGRGIVVHTQSCKNVAGFQKDPHKWITISWEEQTEGEFLVDLRVVVENHRGVLATVAAAVADMESNIDNISLDDSDGIHTTINLTIGVQNRIHLARVIKRLRRIKDVLRIYR
ncbi:MAG: RelA/SpoT family protein [Gammaproteobacteria bacterium]|nr:RelA/SpoT family protein [Gammaproteobacteria bacterium]